MTPKTESPDLLGWDNGKIYFYDENRTEYCVSDETDLMANLITICQDFFKSYPGPNTDLKEKPIR